MGWGFVSESVWGVVCGSVEEMLEKVVRGQFPGVGCREGDGMNLGAVWVEQGQVG